MKGILDQMSEATEPTEESSFVESMREALFNDDNEDGAPQWVIVVIQGRVFQACSDGQMLVDEEPATDKDRKEYQEWAKQLHP